MLGDIASIATLILFVFYFVGRILTMLRTESLYMDELIEETSDFDRKNYNIIEDFILEEDGYNSIILTSKQGIYSLSIFKINYDENLNKLEHTKVDGIDFVNIGCSVNIQLTIPELVTTYEMEYYTHDFKKVTVELWSNLKNGFITESAKPKHTFKSWCYYLFK